MEYVGNIMAVTVEDLTRSNGEEAVMSRGNYDNLAKRRCITVLRPGKGLGHPALIEYMSLPARFRERFERLWGNPEKMLSHNEDMLKMDEEARRFYASYRQADGSALKTEHQKEYMLNATVLQELIRMENTQRSRRHMSGNSTPVKWDGIFAACDRLRDEYGHTLPQSQARLRDKMRQFRKEGYACLVSGKLANTNSTKITGEAGRYIIALKRSRVPVYTVQQLFDKFNADASSRGLKPLKSISTLQTFLQQPEIMAQWKDTESGELASRNIFTRKNSTILPTCRDALWYEDGTKINLYYKTYVPGQGYKVSSLFVCEVIDAYSECLVGYCISDNECFESIYEAVRNAVESTGHIPYEFVTDNQGGTKRSDAKAFFSRIAHIAHTTTPDNPTSKTIEAIFGRFQQQVLHRRWNFTGQNITARSASSKVNAEFVLANREALPTREELIAEYIKCRDEWNAMPHPLYQRPRKELYATSENARAVELSDVLSREIFWLRSQDEITYTASGITITVNKQKYTYEVLDSSGMPDVRFLSNNSGRKFVVEYDPHNMERVRLNIDDKRYGLQHVADAYPYLRNHRAIMDQEDGERLLINRIERANRKERVRRDLANKALEVEFGVAPEQHGLTSPRLKGISGVEYEELADEIRAEEKIPVVPGDVLPDSIGKLEKEMSAFDPIAILDRM